MKKIRFKTRLVFMLLSLLFVGAGNVWADDDATTYTITAGSMSNGSISFQDVSGNTITSATAGTTVVVVVTPNDGYALKTLNYTYSTGSLGTLTFNDDKSEFTMPSANVTVNAVFAKLYDVKASSGENGSISFTDKNGKAITQAIPQAKVYVKVTPTSGYALYTLNYIYDGHEATTIPCDDGTYSFTMPELDVTVNATFAQLHNITASSTTNGSISFTDENGGAITQAIKGATVKVVDSPDVYYELSKLSYNSTEISGNSFIMPDNDVTVSATFDAIPKDRMIYYTTSNEKALELTSDKTISMWGKSGTGSFIIVMLISDVYDETNKRGVLTFSHSVLSIGQEYGSSSPFSQNTSLTSVTIPSTVTLIGGHAFDGCTNLKTIGKHNSKNNDLSNVLYFMDYALNGCSSLGEHTFNDHIKYIGIDAFNGCTSMRNDFVFAYDNLNIGDYAFLGAGVTDVSFEGKNINIGKEAFESCKSLYSVTTSDNGSISSIAESAFEGSSMTIVNIKMTSSIGDKAFYNGSNLISINIDGCTSIGNNAFQNTFKNTFQEGTGLGDVVITGCTSIGDYAFDGCTNIKNVTINGNSCIIGSYAFMLCTELLTAEINGCLSIGKQAFYELKKLNTVSINGSTSVGYKAFESCKALSNVTLTDCTDLQLGAFSLCDNLTKIEIPGTCVSIGHSAFYGTPLTSLTLNEGLETIGELAFAGKLHIKNLVIPASVTTVGPDAFNSCTDIKTVVFKISQDTSVKKNIRYQAFSGCSSLKYVALPKSIDSLGYNVFNGCSALEKIFFISPSCPKLGTLAKTSVIDSSETLNTPFSGMSNNPDIYVPVGSKVSYKKEFTNKGVIKSTTTNNVTTETGDVKSNKVLGWQMIETNQAGYSSFGGSFDEGDGTVVDHRWDLQSYEGLLDDVHNLGLSDISELEIYNCSGWKEYSDKKMAVLFNRMKINNSSSSSSSIYYLSKGDGILLYNGNTGAKRYAILETPATVSDENARTYENNYMKAGKGVALGSGYYYVFGQKNNVTGFYRLYQGKVVPAGKAYLDLKDCFGNNAKIDITFEGFNEDAAGIELINNDNSCGENNVIMHNLQGQRITNPHGFYIMNGKKYYAK